MSRRPRPKLERHVRVYVEGVLYSYAEDRRALREYRDALIPSPVARYGGTGGGGSGESRPAEALGVRMGDDRYIREKLRTLEAVERVLRRCCRQDARLVQLVYIKKTHTVEGAAATVNMGKTMAYDHLNAVLWAVAAELGLVGRPVSGLKKSAEKLSVKM